MDTARAETMTPPAGEKQTKAVAAPLLVAAFFAFGLAGVWLVDTLAPGELIRPVDPDLFAGAIFVGMFAGLLLAARMLTVRARVAEGRRGGRLDALIGALVLPLLVSTACLRIGVQAAAFVGTAPRRVPTDFTIDGFRVSRGTHYLRVRLGEGGRTFSVHVHSDVYGSAQEGDTVTLPVETGRFGIQRAIVATTPTNADLHHSS